VAAPFRGRKVFASKLHLPGKIRLEKPFFLLQVKKLPLFVAGTNAGKIDVKPCRCFKGKKGFTSLQVNNKLLIFG
jgi:hypothetical protein